MSVYVDILPDCCDSCVCNEDYWRCGINGKAISHDSRREDCPLKEIVRCKDCKWFDVNRANFVEGYGYCEIYEVTNKDSHYCSYGEKQVTGKLNNPDDSLLTEDSEACKEQKSKLESDIISRQAAIDAVEKAVFKGVAKSAIESLPPVEPERKWTPCSNPPKHHGDVLVRGIEAIGNVKVHKVMQWDVDRWRPMDYSSSVTWEEWSEI